MNGSKAERTWPGTLMAMGVLLWLMAFWFIGSKTLIAYGELFRWFALFAFAGNLVPFRKVGMDRAEWFLFNLLAIGPFLFAAFLSINFFFHGPVEYYVVPAVPHHDIHRYWIENDALPPMREFEVSGAGIHSKDFILGLAPGAFGHDVIMEWAPIAAADF